MENPEESQYEVIITDPAETAFYDVLEYLYENYEVDRAEEIANEIRDTAQSLHYQAERGTPEPKLQQRTQTYRFILYQRTTKKGIKIIYYIDEKSKVQVTDFFPTEKDDSLISKRS